MDRSLLFTACPEPLAVVVGDLVRDRNPAWAAAVGQATSLAACFAPDDESTVRQAFEGAGVSPVSFAARLAAGPRAGEAMRWTAWSAGGEERCLRLDGPAAATAPAAAAPAAAADVAEIPRSREKALLWIFDQMEAALWTILPDGTIALSEGNALARYGLRPGQIVGSNAYQLYTPGSQSERTTRRVLAGETVRDAYAEGDFYWVQHCSPLRGGDGEIVAQIGLAMAIDDNVRDVHHAQNLLRIVNELPMIVWAMTPDGTCTLSAGKGLAQLGFSPGELVGKNMFELYAGQAVIIDDLRRVLAGESFATERALSDMVFRSSYHTAHDATGNINGMFAVTQDVTTRAHDEHRIREQLALIQSQKQAIDQLVSPILEVWRGVLVVPFIGELAAERATVVTERLLGEVVRHGAHFAILDLTGIDMAETSTAQHLFNIMGGVNLLGCTALISGIRPSVAMTMVTLGIDIPAGRTFATLADALRACLRSADPRTS